MLTKILIVGSVLSFLATGSVSQEKSTPQVQAFQTGNQLLEFCEGKSDADTDFCVGYITGSADHFTFTKALLKFAKQGGEGGTCLPERATPQQLADVFVKYAKNHPEERHLPAQYVISAAWHEAFPCK
jgi:hypothetical protein